MSSWSVPAQQHSIYALASCLLGAMARKKSQGSFSEVQHHLTYLLPVSAFPRVDGIRPNEKLCVKSNILPRDVELSFGHPMRTGARMPKSAGAQSPI